ncbi:MAG: helix-turn-helix domain-containing protein [Acidimicrobiales bacterium]
MTNSETPKLLRCQPELIALFGTLVDVAFCMKDVDGLYLDANDAFVRRWGRSKRAVLGRRPRDIFAPGFATVLEEQDRHVLETGQALRDELEIIIRADQSLGWYITTKLPVFDEASEVAGLVSLSRDLIVLSARDPELGSLSNAVEMMHERFAERLSIEQLAQAAGYSASRFRRRMKQVFGMSPSQYLLRVRVDAAAELLARTKVPVSEVAARCGFYDQAALTRQFARLTGETPSHYRLSDRTTG